jgi:hypothetical protein
MAKIALPTKNRKAKTKEEEEVEETRSAMAKCRLPNSILPVSSKERCETKQEEEEEEEEQQQ